MMRWIMALWENIPLNCEDIYPFIYTIKENKSIGCFVLAYKLIIRGSGRVELSD